MNQEQKKSYIKKHWNISSGARISEMLRRYWVKDEVEEKIETPNSFELAKEIFDVPNQETS